MKNRQRLSFVIVFLVFGSVCFWAWNVLFEKPKEVSIEQPASIYESIELDMPVQAFLARGVSSSRVSMVRRLFLNQWISLYQQDLLKLAVYGQNATSFLELKKLLELAILKESSNNNACSVIEKTLKIIAEDQKLVEHVDACLKEGVPSKIHMLRGRMMNVDKKHKSYKKLKNEYRLALEEWINEKHGSFIDSMIAKV